MRKLVIAGVMVSMILMMNVAAAANWADTPLNERTTVGAVYAASCVYCVNKGRYNNDSGMWQCTNDSNRPGGGTYNQCLRKIGEALIGKYEGT